MKILLTGLFVAVLIGSCRPSALDVEIESYCECADKMYQMNVGVYDLIGEPLQKKSDSLYASITYKLDNENHSISQTKKFAKCASTIAEASRNRLKEFNRLNK